MDHNRKRKLKYVFFPLIFIILSTLLFNLISCSKINNINFSCSSTKTRNILTSLKKSYLHGSAPSSLNTLADPGQKKVLSEKAILQQSLKDVMNSIDETCREYENSLTTPVSIEEDAAAENNSSENNTDKKEQEQQQIQSSISADEFTSSLLYLVNNARNQNGLVSLNLNPSLTAIATARSLDMLNRGYFSHTTPEGKNIFIILQENGIGYMSAGENIQNSTPASAASAQLYFSTWMSSSTHKANILSINFSQIGIGVSFNNDRFVAVIVFLG